MMMAPQTLPHLSLPKSLIEWPVSTPSDRLLLPSDHHYLQFYQIKFRQWDKNIVKCDIGPNRSVFMIPLYRLNFDINCRPFRAATLALASFAWHGPNHRDTNSYLNLYYTSALESITVKDVWGLMDASYIMAIFTCFSRHCLKDIVIHCVQFSRTVSAVLAISPDNPDWMVELWYSVVSTVYYYHRLNQLQRPSIHYYGASERIASLTALLDCLRLNASIACPKSGHVNRDSESRLKVYLFYIQVCFEHFLVQHDFAGGSDGFHAISLSKELLVRILRATVEFLERLPVECTSFKPTLKLYAFSCETSYVNSNLLTSPPSSRPFKPTRFNNLDIFEIYWSSRLLLNLLRLDIDQRILVQ